MVDIRVCFKYASENNLLPFHYSFLMNISSRSYLRISSSMYIAIIFIAKKNLHRDVIKTSILSKPFKFFWIIISMIKLDCSIPFQKKETLTGVKI